tara:strand:- start:564 stop:779 length:216 start_codon:yes stop_codon:yes gene_type:complete
MMLEIPILPPFLIRFDCHKKIEFSRQTRKKKIMGPASRTKGQTSFGLLPFGENGVSNGKNLLVDSVRLYPG